MAVRRSYYWVVLGEGEEFGTEIDRGWITGRLIGCV